MEVIVLWMQKTAAGFGSFFLVSEGECGEINLAWGNCSDSLTTNLFERGPPGLGAAHSVDNEYLT
jgi:hypothetical protein